MRPKYLIAKIRELKRGFLPGIRLVRRYFGRDCYRGGEHDARKTENIAEARRRLYVRQGEFNWTELAKNNVRAPPSRDCKLERSRSRGAHR